MVSSVSVAVTFLLNISRMQNGKRLDQPFFTNWSDPNGSGKGSPTGMLAKPPMSTQHGPEYRGSPERRDPKVEETRVDNHGNGTLESFI